MKILVIGRYFEEGLALFVARELAQLGHSVARYDPGPTMFKYSSQARFYFNKVRHKAVEAAQNVKIMSGKSVHAKGLRKALAEAGGADLIISLSDFLSPADVDALKAETSAPLILWYPDPVWSFRRHMFLNAAYDMLFFKDPYLVHMLRSKLGARVFYMPECYSPTSLDPAMGAPLEAQWQADICIAGNLYAYRVAFFEQLADRDLKIWGPPAPTWLRTRGLQDKIQNRYVAHDDKVSAFRGAKIVLNTLNPSEIWGTNVRTFEACGAGAFQIVDWRPGLGALFEIGKEVEIFTDQDDLRSKINRYLAAPEERAAIAQAGQARAARDHTYAVRLAQLLDVVEGRSSGYPEPAPAWDMQKA
ncbi:MAG: glycosyltransferase [Pseudomonadota bacterium]